MRIAKFSKLQISHIKRTGNSKHGDKVSSSVISLQTAGHTLSRKVSVFFSSYLPKPRSSLQTTVMWQCNRYVERRWHLQIWRLFRSRPQQTEANTLLPSRDLQLLPTSPNKVKKKKLTVKSVTNFPYRYLPNLVAVTFRKRSKWPKAYCSHLHPLPVLLSAATWCWGGQLVLLPPVHPARSVHCRSLLSSFQ